MSPRGRVPPTAAVPGARWTASILAVSAGAALCAVLGRPLLWGVLTVLAAAVLLGSGSWGALTSVPVASLVVAASVMVALLVAGAAGLTPLHHGAVVVGILLSANAVVASLGLLAPPSRARPGTNGPSSSWSVVLVAPTLVMAVLGLVSIADSSGRLLAWFLSGDHLRHLALVTRLWDSGALEYDSQTYPRGLHSLVGALWASTGAGRDQAGLRDLISTHAAVAWAVASLLCLAISLLAARMLQLGHATVRQQCLGGALAGCLVMGPVFFGDYLTRGFETSVLAVLILATVLLEFLGPSVTRAHWVACLGLALMAHTWQILLAPAMVLLVMTTLEAWRRRAGPLWWAAVGGPVVGAVVVAVPGLMGAVRGYGLSAVTDTGDVPEPLLLAAVVVVICSVGLTVWQRRAGTAALLVTCAIFTTAFAIVVVKGLPWASYYPNKTVWAGVALGLPSVAALVTRGVAALDERHDAVRLALVPSVVAVLVAAALSAATPVLGVMGAWGAADAALVLRTVTAESAPRAAVVWQVGGPVDDATSQLLLDFYSATSTSPPLGLAPVALTDQCALLRGAASPLVLSDADATTVRLRFTCVDAVEVTRVTAGAP